MRKGQTVSKDSTNFFIRIRVKFAVSIAFNIRHKSFILTHVNSVLLHRTTKYTSVTHAWLYVPSLPNLLEKAWISYFYFLFE